MTDNREWAEQLLASFGPDPFNAYHDPAGPSYVEGWRDLSTSGLLPAEKALWEAVDGDVDLSLCEIAPRPELDGWDYLLLMDTASGSQFDQLRKLDPAKLPGSVASVAATGSGFHGHHGRSWQTLRGNLHLSTHVNPEVDAARCGLAMTTLPAVAVLDALDQTGPYAEPAQIKWVNDILILGHKVSGVLTATQSLQGRLSGLTLGIGLNIAAAPKVPPTPFVPTTGCLADLFRGETEAPKLGSVLTAVLSALSSRLQSVRDFGPDSLVDAYRNRNLIVGKRVAIWQDNANPLETVEPEVEPLAIGIVRAIGPDLALTLEGHPEAIRCGRLALQLESDSH